MDYLKKFESYKPEEGLVEYFIDLDSSQGGNFDVDIINYGISEKI